MSLNEYLDLFRKAIEKFEAALPDIFDLVDEILSYL